MDFVRRGVLLAIVILFSLVNEAKPHAIGTASGSNLLSGDGKPVYGFKRNDLTAAGVVTIWDDKTYDLLFDKVKFPVASVKSSISLRITDFTKLPTQSNTLSFEVDVSVVAYTDANNPDLASAAQTKTLKVTYNRLAGTTYKAFDNYDLPVGAYKMEMTVTDVRCAELPVAVLPKATIRGLEVSECILVTRKYALPANKIVDVGPLTVTGSVNNDAGILSLNYETALAQEYDVEMAPIDLGSPYMVTINAMLADNFTIPDESLDVLFRNNTTRITNALSRYQFTLFDNDYVVARVRTVNYDAAGNRLRGPWNYKCQKNGNTQIKYNIWAKSWTDQTKNFQYAVAYAEEGKKKEVISYFDGTLRNRQSVTLASTEPTTPPVPIVQEDIYDVFGRKSVAILPAPAEVGEAEATLHYFQNFNLANDGSPYSVKNINGIAMPGGCEMLPDVMNNLSGSSKYYSPNNLFKDLVKSKFNKAIPDAQGYPFSVTQYTADNTGRIKLQGGVGPAFQPGTGTVSTMSRTSKYYYGKPEQWELDQLFGNDVGYAEHYTKNMVIDPNGQISLSYLNASGKTIATALTGPNPANLDPLPALNTENVKSDYVKVLNPAQFIFNRSELKITANTTYLAAIPDHNVSLQVNIEQLKDRYPDNVLCSNCFYRLVVKVTDDCGNNIPVNNDQDLPTFGSATSNAGYTDPQPIKTIANVDFAKPGEYHISVEFLMDQQVIDNYTDNYVNYSLSNNLLLGKYNFIKTKYLSTLQLADCYKDCVTCQVMLTQGEPAFTALVKTRFSAFGVDVNTDPVIKNDFEAWSLTTFNNLKIKCEALQENCSFAPCSSYENQMLADVSPGGQYALFKDNLIALEPQINVLLLHFLHVFGPANLPSTPLTDDDYVSINGKKISVYSAEFNFANMVQNWNPVWAYKFLPYHPESCKLTFCKANEGSKNWDEQVKHFVTRIADLKKINGGVDLIYSESTPLLLYNLDPFFKLGATGYKSRNNFIADLQSYTDRVLKLTGPGSAYTNVSLPRYIKYLLYCKSSSATGEPWQDCTPVCNAPEKEFNMYRDMYMELKAIYYEKIMNDSTCTGQLTCPVGGSAPIVQVPGDCPTSINFSLEKDEGYHSPCDNWSQPIRISYLGGALNNNTTLELYYSPGVNNYLYNFGSPGELGPRSVPVIRYVTFTPGQRYAYVCLPAEASLSDVKIKKVTCSGSATVIPVGKYIDIVDEVIETSPVRLFETVNWIFGTYWKWYTAYDKVNKTTVTLKDKLGNDINATENIPVIVPYLYLTTDAYGNNLPAAPASLLVTIPMGKSFGIITYNSAYHHHIDGEHPHNQHTYLNLDKEKNPTVPSNYLIWGNSSNPTTTTCDPILLTKDARFPPYPENGNGSQPLAIGVVNQITQNNDNEVAGFVKISCEATADELIEKLRPGIIAINKLGMIDQLRVRLIAVCTAGGGATSIFGASKISTATSYGDLSFGDAIKNTLQLANFTPALNPWLINSPFPYDMPQKNTRTLITSGSTVVCNKIQALRTEYQATLPQGQTATDGGLYTYLKTRFGLAMDLTSDQFTGLLTSCTSCNELMPDEIALPVFMDPSTSGYITRAQYNTALASLNSQFGGNLATTTFDNQVIFATFMNMQWGYNLSFDNYKAFQNNTETILLNRPKYLSVKPDPYACALSLIDGALASGVVDYDKYIYEAREAFKVHYIATCSAAKAYTALNSRTPQYHYTLYYYDQADNLVRTVPPEGVKLITSDKFTNIDNVRDKGDAISCTYTGPSVTDKTGALNTLSSVLSSTTDGAIEMWLFNDGSSEYTFKAFTLDKKYLFQAGISGTKLYVDIYPTDGSVPGSLTFIPSTRHFQADISARMPLDPFVHIVMQGTGLGSATLPQLYLNGAALTVVNNSSSPSPLTFSATATSNGVVVPDYFASIKHLVIYSHKLSTTNITADAASTCFTFADNNKLGWYRFNIPLVGGMTTAGDNTTNETTNFGWFPQHSLASTYAYNSTNQVTRQYSPDGGVNRYWYDLLSRLVVSQNDKQLAENKYSYTLYEPQLGRITEVGQKNNSNVNLGLPDFLTNTQITGFNASGTNVQVTNTWYDGIVGGIGGVTSPGTQENLRKRVWATAYRENAGDDASQATYYSYDVSGNVKTLWQKIGGLNIKRIDYEFDEVSGKVNFLSYQNGMPDQFYYQYDYDAENRLVKAWSGTQAIVEPYSGSHLLWNNRKLDADYYYYLHGPLARTVLGAEHNRVQGIDYAYTLQGWLKGINSTNLAYNNDPSEDGKPIPTSPDPNRGNTIATADAYGLSLQYNNSDYQPISNFTPFADPTGVAGFQSLYNGNIAASAVNIAFPGATSQQGPQLAIYKYDQLNRLTGQDVFKGLNVSNNTWSPIALNDYKEQVTYDPNGNINTYVRNGIVAAGNSGALMDNLTYNYFTDPVTGRKINNRLKSISDNVGSSLSAVDIDNQAATNYQYDAIGNLTADGITGVEWSVYGKIKNITGSSPVSYTYNTSQQRVSKKVGAVTTYYVRDAQGNTLAVYDGSAGVYTWKEQYLYGSSRLGTWLPAISNIDNAAQTAASIQWTNAGLKQYELTNHQDNVLAAITDRTVLSATNDSYTADVVNAQDYYPFGMLQPGRTYSANVSYRYGFNGKENDNDVGKGDGNQQDYGMRIYDPRVGRFLSVDPLGKDYPELTSYQYSSNRPIDGIDVDGLEFAWAQDLWNQAKSGYNTTIKVIKESYIQAEPNINAFGRGLHEVARNLAPIRPADDRDPKTLEESWERMKSIPSELYNLPGKFKTLYTEGSTTQKIEGTVALVGTLAGSIKGKAPATGIAIASFSFKAPIIARHLARAVKISSYTKELNTVADNTVNLLKDVEDINKGLATRIGDVFKLANERVYRQLNGHLFPVSGPGLTTLSRGGFKALGVLNEFGNSERAAGILSKMKNVGSAEIKAAKEVYDKIKQ
jgi:RHS repeat-associated protein